MRALCLAIAVMLVGVNVSAAEGQSNGVREVSASERSLIPLTTKLRYTTMILLPDQEEILDVVCGDRDYWVFSAREN
jgi:type IV secretory pathway VirB9-like protein